ncbi:hypothetical protein JB92DRAFT_3116440 [Gautieria morchelliformis]|nr:hypothetical protein JB92DRAFT_3116440 [Gautieria morchelliformis]
MKAQIPTVSADDPFVVIPHLGTPSTASLALSIPDLPLPSHSTTPSPSMFTIPDFPLPSHSSQYPASKGPTVLASLLDMPPSNQLAAFHTTTNLDSGYQSPPMYNSDTGAIETTPHSKRNLSYLTDSVTIMPGDRRHGDTVCLWEPPDAHTAFTYNRHVPPLQGSQLEEAFQNLRSNKDPPTSTASQPHTRASIQQSANKTRAELLSDLYTAVRNKDGARTFLDKNGYFTKEELLTMELLSQGTP